VRSRDLPRWQKRKLEEERKGREERFQHAKEREGERDARGTDGIRKNRRARKTFKHAILL